MIDPGHVERLRLRAQVCKALTDPKRLALLEALGHGERSVGELAASVGVSLPNASQHLGVMRGAGLVETRRAGASVRYRLAEPAIAEACAIIDGMIARRLAAPSAAPIGPSGPSISAALLAAVSPTRLSAVSPDDRSTRSARR